MNLKRIYDIYDNIYNILPEKYPKPKLVFYEDSRCMEKAFDLKPNEAHMVYDYSSKTINIPVLETQKLTDNDIEKILLHEIYHSYIDINKVSIKSNEEFLADCFSARWSKKINIKDNKFFLGWTKDEIEYLKTNYPWKSINDIIKTLGRNWTTIKSKASKLGLKRVNHSKYNCNHFFFSPPFNKNNMWVAGFIAADGCIRHNSNNIKIDISNKDIDLLYKIKEFINFDGKIKEYIRNNKKYAVISFSSKQMVKDLNRYFNITSKKNNAFFIPDNIISSNIFSHFLRGYSDGNGSFYIEEKNGSHHLRYKIAGNKKTLEQILVWFENFDIKPVKIIKERGAYYIKFGGNIKVNKIAECLYNDLDGAIYLVRKKNVLSSNLIQKTQNKKFVSVIRIDPLTGNKEEFKSIKDAVKLGYTYSGIFDVCNGRSKTHRGFNWEYKK
jgi:hypothetical protein